ncbi:permease of the major facilitator superfamily [Pestalotiopsis sp. NC0098]|nr:permease of the major facilitator superfamily [Pestalotiopsis sp. NC0098]
MKKISSIADNADIGKGEITAIKMDHIVPGESKDKALDLLRRHNIEFDPDSDEAKRVLRKIDWRIMPMIFTIYLLQLMDKNSLSFAAIMDLKTDTHLTASQYSWLGSIVYFGYLGGEIPAMFLMQRLPLAKFLAGMAMLWGIVVAMHAVCKDFGSLAAVRFILGAVEVVTAPAAIYITGSYYTKSEQVTRVAIWYTTSGWAAVAGGFCAWALNRAEYFKWQGLFVLYGGLTFVIGVVLWFWLAASPTEASWLTEREKVIALERVRENKTGTEVWSFSWPQLKECFRDVRFYLIFLLLVSTGLPNGGVTAFGPTIISGFGFDTNQSTLLNMGSGGAQVAGTVLALFICKHTNRTVGGIWTLVLAVTGVIMMLAIPEANYGARYGGYILMMQFPICILFIIAYMTGGVAGSTKKFAFGAVYQLGYAAAKYTMLAFLAFTAVLIVLMGLTHMMWNSKRDAKNATDAEDATLHVENEEFEDMTDFKLKSFRYPI